jgi:lipopolysaccharide transport system ATP-binding protein
MSKAEIKRKFDEIVAFAEVEKFLDTPVKRYSSGMYVRLAFAVAAHLEPEILIVDEVLAVGDTAFQKKCLGKMEDVGKEGRTVLFVSHDMRAIQKLCNQAMLLVQGKCSILNSVNNVIDLYISVPDKNTDKHELLNLPRRPGLGLKARIDKVELLNSLNKSVEELKFGEYFSLKVRCLVLEPINNISFVIGIDSILKTRITTLISDSKTSISRGEIIESKVNLNKLLLNPGYYYVTVGLVEYKICLDRIEHAKGFRVNQVSANPEFIDKEIVTYGLLQVPDAEWVIKSSKSNRLHNQVRYSKHGFNKRNY